MIFHYTVFFFLANISTYDVNNDTHTVDEYNKAVPKLNNLIYPVKHLHYRADKIFQLNICIQTNPYYYYFMNLE